VLLATGCSANGGGTLSPLAPTAACADRTSASGAATQRPQITFGFYATSTVAQPDVLATFDGTFMDGCAGVTLHGVGGLEARPAPPEAPAGHGLCAAGTVPYDSTAPGSTFDLIVCAAGTLSPLVDGDFVEINVNSGPYAGYSVIGVVQHGSLVVKQ
jgi:hypothetical protein